MRRARHIILISLGITCFQGFSQGRIRYRYEWLAGAGPTNFLGDLGGANSVGTHFLRDFDFNSSRFCLNGGIRYKKGSYFAFKGMLALAVVSGNDKFTHERFRNNRNLNFTSPIIELSAQAEYYFIQEKLRNPYRISGLRNRKKKKNVSAYIFSGIGAFFFNPYGRYNGKWYSLRKYHTEGEGLPGGPKPYSNFNVCIPIGIGAKYMISHQLSVGAEFAVRKTFTDYIDDVSDKYYDKAKLAQAYGPTAVMLSDPSKGDIIGATTPGADGTGAQRGDPRYKDSYMFLTFTLAYKINKRRRTRAKF